jgi:hypothetical protein
MLIDFEHARSPKCEKDVTEIGFGFSPYARGKSYFGAAVMQITAS